MLGETMKPSELTKMSVSDLTTDARTFSSDERASTLIGYLREAGAYGAFVEEEGRTSIVTLHGLLDVRDLDTRLAKLMQQVPRLTDAATVGDAAGIMLEYRTRLVPVYRGKRLAGQITGFSIVEKMLGPDLRVKLSSLMTPAPVTLDSSAPVSTAKDLMRRRKIDQIPIVDDGELKNVITSADVVFNLAPRIDRDKKGDKKRGRYAVPVDSYGDSEVVSNDITDSVHDVFLNMKNKSANYSVIVNTGETQGIITCGDFMKVITQKQTAPTVPMYIIGMPENPFDEAMVREKFLESATLITRVLPDVVEVRAVIEAEGNNPVKKKSLVKVTVISPRKQYSYNVFSYELADAFDQVHTWVKRLVEQEKPSRKPGRKNSIGRRGSPPGIEGSTPEDNAPTR
jgi:CBS domain-containing protein